MKFKIKALAGLVSAEAALCFQDSILLRPPEIHVSSHGRRDKVEESTVFNIGHFDKGAKHIHEGFALMT
jgi:hypothetical protein